MELPPKNQIEEKITPSKRQGKSAVEASTVSGELGREFDNLDRAVAQDLAITQDDLARLGTALENTKLHFGGREVSREAFDQEIKCINAFLGNILFHSTAIPRSELPPLSYKFVKPQDQTYTGAAISEDDRHFGEYTLNPETFGMDFEKAKIFIPDLSQFGTIPGHNSTHYKYDRYKYIVETYSDKYYMPGIEMWKWMSQDNIKAEILFGKQNLNIFTDGIFLFPGSTFIDPEGLQCVPESHFTLKGVSTSIDWSKNKWYGDEQIILIEK